MISLCCHLSYNLHGAAGENGSYGGSSVLPEKLPLMYSTSSDYGVVIFYVLFWCSDYYYPLSVNNSNLSFAFHFTQNKVICNVVGRELHFQIK